MCRLLKCLFCLVITGTSIVHAQESDLALRNRFLHTVPQTAQLLGSVSFEAKCIVTQDYQALSKSLRAQLLDSKVDPDKPTITEFICAVRGKDGFAKGIDRQGFEFVKAKNGTYSFILKRTPVSKHSSFTLTLLERYGDNAAVDQRIEDSATEYASSLLRTWYFGKESVARLIESPNFRLKNVSTVASAEGELARIEFDRMMPDPKLKSMSYSDAFMLCDPSNLWALKEYGCTAYDGEMTFRTTIQYGKTIKGFPIPEKITHLASSSNDATITRSVITVELLREDVPKEELHLSFYGRPEPTFKHDWFGPWLWYLIAGAVCMFTAVTITKCRRTRLG